MRTVITRTKKISGDQEDCKNVMKGFLFERPEEVQPLKLRLDAEVMLPQCEEVWSGGSSSELFQEVPNL